MKDGGKITKQEDELLQSILKQFMGSDYYKPLIDGFQMNLREIKDYPIKKLFFVHLNPEKNRILKVVKRDSIEFANEVSSLYDSSVLEDLMTLLQKNKIDATIFH